MMLRNARPARKRNSWKEAITVVRNRTKQELPGTTSPSYRRCYHSNCVLKLWYSRFWEEFFETEEDFSSLPQNHLERNFGNTRFAAFVALLVLRTHNISVGLAVLDIVVAESGKRNQIAL